MLARSIKNAVYDVGPTPAIYLHDIRDDIDGLVGANRSNANSLLQVEEFLLSNPGTLITADDGYRSIKRLIPILHSSGSKLILFVTTGFISREIYSYEVLLSNILAKRPSVSLEGERVDLISDADREHAFLRVHRRLKPSSIRARTAYMEAFMEENALDMASWRETNYLSWAELKEILASGVVEVGAHTHSHVFLPSVPVLERLIDIRKSVHLIRRHLGVWPRYFSYPYGGHDRATRALVRLLGFRDAFGTEGSSNERFSRKRIPLAK